MITEKPLVLCVDDERNVVETMVLNLRRRYKVLTALSGREGLELIDDNPDVAVVVSDMRMPNMDGAAFLAAVKAKAPTAVRMLLTGYSDIDAAMRAVNEGQIYRFLTKPCAPEQLIETLEAGVEQHRLITAERVLLQKTLLGSVKAIVEVMALGHPLALGRAVRVRDTVRKVLSQLGIEQPWRVEFAALLSQLGAVSLSDETLHRLYDGEPLDDIETKKLKDNMATVTRILENIPRLEPVTGLLRELTSMDGIGSGSTRGASREALLLRAAIEIDSLEAQGHSMVKALSCLRKDEYGDELLTALRALAEDPDEMKELSIRVQEVKDGMILCDDLKTGDGILILPRGFSINQSSREHILGFPELLTNEIRVLAPADADETSRRTG